MNEQMVLRTECLPSLRVSVIVGASLVSLRREPHIERFPTDDFGPERAHPHKAVDDADDGERRTPQHHVRRGAAAPPRR